ncbi:MAG: type II toxin-antitoxin system HicB family antitoxin [Clostridia bacterium]
MRYLYTAIFTPNADDSGYTCCVPDIPHCHTSGRDLADALDLIVDAASLMLVTYEDDHTPIPPPTPFHLLAVPTGSTPSLVQLDTDRYRILNDTHPVRKSVSVPAWMAALADREGLSCSQILQEGLRQRLGAPPRP